MANINLLPWRESRRKRSNKRFIRKLLLTGFVGVIMVALGWTYLEYLKESQQKANAQIIALNLALDASVKDFVALTKRRKALITTRQLIEGLQVKRAIPVQAWNDIAKAVPKQVSLTFLKREGDVIRFRGNALNPSKVSILINNLESMPRFEKAQIKLIKQSETDLHSSIGQSALAERSTRVNNNPSSNNEPFNPSMPLSKRTASNSAISRTINKPSNSATNEVAFLVTVHMMSPKVIAEHQLSSAQPIDRSSVPTNRIGSEDTN